MKMAPRRAAAVAALAFVPLLAFGTTAAAANQTITYKLRATAAGQTAETSLTQDIDSNAPATVAPGGTVTVTVDPAPNRVPGSAGGYSLREIKDFVMRIPVPANSSYLSASLTGGSGLGATPPTVGLEGTDIVLRLKGPLKANATFELPTLTINLRAGSAGTIQTRLGGTSYDNPGLTFTAVVVVLFPINAPTKGFPDPSPVLTSTSIS